jgi:hypothetical protein
MPASASFAFGPPPGYTPLPRIRPSVLTLAFALGAVAIAAVAGAVVLATSEDASPVRTATVADPLTGTATETAFFEETATAFDAGAAPSRPALPPVRVTEVRLTDGVDSLTGEPGAPVDSFGAGDAVRLWFSFEAMDLSRPVTVVWLREERKVARLTAPLPNTASEMVFPLPEVAADRAGMYRVEIRSARDVLATETFEVTGV